MVWSKTGGRKMNKQMKTFKKYCGDDGLFISILSIAITTLFFGSIYNIPQDYTISNLVITSITIIIYSLGICTYYYVYKWNPGELQVE